MSTADDQAAADTPVEELVTRAVAGSSAAFAGLVERYTRPLYRFLVVRTRDSGDAEELVQDVFVRAWEHLASYDPRHAFATWLFTIAHRRAVDLHRRRARSHVELLDEHDSGEVDPGEASSTREQESNLWHLAGRVLGDEARAALWLRHVEGLDVDEVARVLARSRASVRVLVFRARRTLAAVLGDRERAGARLAPEPSPGDARAADRTSLAHAHADVPPRDWYPPQVISTSEVLE